MWVLLYTWLSNGTYCNLSIPVLQKSQGAIIDIVLFVVVFIWTNTWRGYTLINVCWSKWSSFFITLLKCYKVQAWIKATLIDWCLRNEVDVGGVAFIESVKYDVVKLWIIEWGLLIIGRSQQKNGFLCWNVESQYM